jgi:hypothetical protein
VLWGMSLVEAALNVVRDGKMLDVTSVPGGGEGDIVFEVKLISERWVCSKVCLLFDSWGGSFGCSLCRATGV